MSDLVTGDAVVLELRLAKLASRTLALLVDFAILVPVMIGFYVVTGSLVPAVDQAAMAAIALTGTVFVLSGYFVALETLTRGRTVGKIALGLRVVRDDGGPIRFRHALVRGLLLWVDIYLTWGVVALATSLASNRGKRVGDLLAGTVVVRERVPVRGAPVAQMPPPLAAWARELQMSRLPDDLALAARQFLARTNELAPAVRQDMALRLAREVSRYISPPPPTGTPPEPYLAAVLVERRGREAARLAGPSQPYAPQPPPYGVPPHAGPPYGVPPYGQPSPPYRAPSPAPWPAPSPASPAPSPAPSAPPLQTGAATRYEQPTVPYERSVRPAGPRQQPQTPTPEPERTAPSDDGFAPPG